MKKPSPFPYSSIHEFLDENLSKKGIQDADRKTIKHLKRKYWRLKNNHIKSVKRYENRTTTVFFSSDEETLLKSRLQEGQSFPQLVHSLVLASIKDESVFVIQKDPVLEQLLFQVIDLLEDVMEQSPIHHSHLQNLQDKIHKLEKHFE